MSSRRCICKNSLLLIKIYNVSILQVKFHGIEHNKLISGSTDGLINVFDLSQNTEDNALIDSLNTESSVDSLYWYVNEFGKDAIFCSTHTHDVQLWNIDDAAPFAHFHRDELSTTIKVN